MKWLLIPLFAALVVMLIIDRSEIETLKSELAMAKAESNSVPTEKKKVRFIKRDQSRTRMFAFLNELNSEQKKIRYLPGELIIEDPRLSQNDRFLDFLDLLYEQQQIVMIEIPENKTIREDLKLAGFSSEYVTKSKDGIWRIKIKE